MKYCLFCLSIFLFLNLSTRAWAQPADEYNITFLEQDEQTVLVSARLTLTDSLLYMSPAGPVPERWPQYVKNLIVRDRIGKELPVEENPGGGWILPARRPGQQIQLEYTLSLTHEEESWPGGIDGVAYQRDWGAFFTGRALFVMNGEEKQGIKVRFQLPRDWKVSTPWQAIDRSGLFWQSPNLDQLTESMIFAGTHEELHFERGGLSLKFVLGGEGIVQQKHTFAERAEKLMNYYTEMMGGLPVPPPGQELSTVMVVINADRQVDGEVIGNHISMFMDPDGDMQSQMMGWFMFAHEFFHLWNGKTLRVSDTRADWFKEGVTNYYTLKALHQIGFIDEAGVRAILNGLFYQRYINDPGLGELSIAEAGSTFRKDAHWGLVYGGGLFTGICLDMIIRKNTDNEKSLDVLMRNFYGQYGGSDRVYGTGDVIAEAGRLGGENLEAFAGQYINGTEQAPLSEYLSYAGMIASTENGQLILAPKEQRTELEKQIWAGFLGE